MSPERVFVLDGKLVLPALVLRHGRYWDRCVIFEPFSGSKLRRVRHGRILGAEAGRAFLAWRRDPMADVLPKEKS